MTLRNNDDVISPTKEIPVAFAFDFMRVKPNTIHVASNLTPALRLLYPDVTCNNEKDNVNSFEDNEQSSITAKDIMSVPGMFAAKGIL
eukprot:CAMPEP_0197843042 /NCGR_PEP_ID=MMETSP1437-20131217/47093_1 /TAXON_ID=49252 ORGANISM="Eucampia antarctica, Strain CCMP1452" /NCGR_SAMPLE_ID=MMETSP1437 /ASSEMBLY_ACC=CAM_ASM_001096 /LENGTH=87 /DNA_ID=CAMNT_0043453023 /DNA_START=857 /DNA_END=1120 /DNA_ORIENTATION=+